MNRRIFPFSLLLALLLCCALPAGAERNWNPPNEETANKLALSVFCHCAFHPEYGGEDPGVLNRWEEEITVWLGGSPTPEDRETLDAFLKELSEKVPNLPSIRRVRQDAQANVRIWYVPARMLPFYIEGYVDGNWGFFHYDHPKGSIISARIGISTDVTEQEERVHLIREELVGALGLPGDHDIYADSILYDPWTVTQTLSDVDWRMLNMLYHPSLSVGMKEEEASAVLKKEYEIQ